MHRTTRSPQSLSCPRCAGLLYRDYDGDACCLLCGTYVYATPIASREAARLDRAAPRKRGRPRKAARVA
jgi:uncharacterized Zn finger protein (UPF0148 family)